jgi:hypothetical protein
MPKQRNPKAYHLLIATMLSNPAFTSQDIANKLSISKSTVDKVRQSLNKAVSTQESLSIELESYRELLRKHVPVAKRVSVLSKVRDMADSNPFVALRSVEMVDDRLGLTPKTMPQSDLERDTRPMFVLPGDAKVQVNITNNYQASNTESDKPLIDK